MKLSPKITLLIANSDGLGAAVANGLSVKPDSDLFRKQFDLQLSLVKYGIKGPELSCSVIDFIHHSGSPQVTVILMPDLQPPIAACAANEILSSVIPGNSSDLSLVVIPIFKTSPIEDKSEIFGVEIGPQTELTQALLHGISKPPSLRINSEILASLVQMIRVLNIPSFIIGSNFYQHGVSTKNHDVQEVNQIGEFLANCTGLSFSNGGIYQREKQKVASQEPWRALYG